MTGKDKILIVDDEKINVAVLTSYLADNYDVITASNGEEALKIVKKEEPDLILLDVVMPGMDGFDICKIIKHDYKLDFIPIIMLTALTSRNDHHKGIEVGADDFLKKPADRFELDKKITALLRIKEHHDSLLQDRNKAYEYLDYVGVLIAVLDRDYKLIHINQKGADILGYNRNNIINRDWIDLIVSESYANLVKRKYDMLLDGIMNEPECSEYPIMTITRKEKLFKWHYSVLRDAKGNITNILMSGEDITEKRKDEIKLMEYAKELQKSNEIKDLFTDVLRHDLLNPAGLIKSFTELLEETGTNEKQQRLIENIKKSNLRLIGLIDNAAKLAKLESINEMAFVKTNISQMINDVQDNFEQDLKSKNITLKSETYGQHPALANPMIEGVFSNLISNAIKYSPENTNITVKVEDLADKLKISVADQGDGVPDKDKEAVFTRFNRLHKENIKGSGIGLAIVKRIMDLHGENVGVIDNPQGRGSVFWFTLKKAL
ncbi:PAS domain S-box-containing protein [Methanolobus vulcani]|uniref:PAS domain S-box-containing protein n=1 Tax=Methanolobus vulcani TaxID=38026 RepID=A0A7Z7AZB3_9EURY|nr:response regulator [Methanolobus vulcani]MDK2948711.1 two-component system, cell cycle response regulator [Methanolobus sp.]SDF71332.1 PAS domain S-box-containing protein [Methanolobus vulcani]